MAIIDLFSKRQKRLRGEVTDVYVYDQIPKPLRVQLVQIIHDGIGDTYDAQQLYCSIHRSLCREYGVFKLCEDRSCNDWNSVANFLLETNRVEHVLDVVELCLQTIHTEVRTKIRFIYQDVRALPDDSISEANQRFKEHAVGYEFVSGEIIRVDSQFLHSEVVKPALQLLAGQQYKGANDEFLKAHEHYRHGRHKECLAECLKAFESTMKTICDTKGWTYAPCDTAKTLIEICIDKGLFPTFLQTQLGNLRSFLESGVPTVRNKLGGHGQGANVTIVPEATARFALHSTATNILFFLESAQTQ
jgi:hypothetical protein